MKYGCIWCAMMNIFRGIEAYAVLDSECRIVELTGSLEKFLLYEKNSLVEAQLRSLIHPDDYADVESA